MTTTDRITPEQQHEANLRSGHVGVRWQAQMEEHLASVRALTNEAMLHGIDPEQAALRGALAQAQATSALALAVANGLSDLEFTLDAPMRTIAERIDDVVHSIGRD